MKILQVITSLNPYGAENLLVNCAIELNKRGLRCDILIIYHFKNNFLVEKAENSGVNVFKFNIKNRYNIFAYYKLRKFIIVNNYEIVHSHLFPANYLVALLPKKTAAKITTEHSTSNGRRKYFIIKYFEKHIYNKYNKIICISASVKESLGKWMPGISAKIEVVYNGIPLESFNNPRPINRKILKVPENVPLFCMVARLTAPQKDHPTLIRAVASNKIAHLLLVGQGPEEDRLKKLSKELNVLERVHFLGFRKDIPELIKSSDLIVNSTTFEGFCIGLVESMATGTPCFISNIAGVKEILEEQTSNCTFPPGDYKALAAKFDYFLNNRLLYNDIASKLKIKARKYSIVTMIDSVIDIYQRVLQR